MSAPIACERGYCRELNLRDTKMNAEIIPSRRWRNIKTGAIASVYGACPWFTKAAKTDWQMESTGYTIKWPDGTVGIGREPFVTIEAAQACLNRMPGFPGMNQG